MKLLASAKMAEHMVREKEDGSWVTMELLW